MENDVILKVLDEIKEEIGGIKKEIGGIKEEIGGIKEEIKEIKVKIKEMDEKIDKNYQETISEYKSFTKFIEEKYSELNTDLSSEINTSNNNLDEYKKKVTQGIKEFEKAVG